MVAWAAVDEPAVLRWLVYASVVRHLALTACVGGDDGDDGGRDEDSVGVGVVVVGVGARVE